MTDDMTASELLAALEVAGRHPDLALIRRCLAEQEKITPVLLQWLDQAGSEEEDEWEDEDPRWYRPIHAGLLLIAYREPAALPLFGRIFRDPKQENLIEWFSEEIPAYGPAAIDWAIELVQDGDAKDYPRSTATEILLYLAWHFPEERDRILRALRGVLPPLDAEGQLLLPQDDLDEPDAIWTWTAYALAELHDRASEPQITALYHEDLIDTMVMGDLDKYRRLLTSAEIPHSVERKPSDILENYSRLAAHDNRIAEWKDPARPTFDIPTHASTPPATRPAEPPPIYSDWEMAMPYVRAEPKVGRNDPCPCGSGKKYKQCHGKKQN